MNLQLDKSWSTRGHSRLEEKNVDSKHMKNQSLNRTDLLIFFFFLAVEELAQHLILDEIN